VSTIAVLGALPAAIAEPHPGHGPVLITISEFSYSPREVNATEGDYVLWNWRGPDTNHSATADPGQSVSFDSDAGKSPEQVSHPLNDGYSVQFTKAGDYTFHCKVHATMTGIIHVLPLPPALQPQPPVTPVLSHVHVTAAKACSSAHCTRAAVLVRFYVNEAVSMRASLRRMAGSRPAGKTLKEIDFNGPPGTNRQKLSLGRLRHGRYQLRLVAIDQSSGEATKPVSRVVTLP
jgi:plastocyanin